jgi:uncharacterized membrane protein
MKKNTPPTLDQLQQSQVVRNVNIEHKNYLGRLDKIALWITNHVGSMGFFILIFCWTILWFAWNMLVPKGFRFDPYPAFVLWLFISNVIQIFLMPLIMVGQNLLSQYAEVRSEVDFEINKKAELEIESILFHLERQNKLILQILERLENEKNESKES